MTQGLHTSFRMAEAQLLAMRTSASDFDCVRSSLFNFD